MVDSSGPEEYPGAPQPGNELERLAALQSLGVVNLKDTKVCLDRVCQLLCQVFEVPMGGVSLVEDCQVYMPSFQGIGSTYLPRTSSFCQWTLLSPQPDVLMIEDTTTDARGKDHPVVVGPPFVRSYYGAPLVSTSGHRIGTLCVLDTNPRSFSPELCSLLANLAELVVRELEWGKDPVSSIQQPQQQPHLRDGGCAEIPVLLVDTLKDGWTVLLANTAFLAFAGKDAEAVLDQRLSEVFQQCTDLCTRHQRDAVAERSFSALLALGNNGEAPKLCIAHFRPASRRALDGACPFLSIPAGCKPKSGKQDCHYYFVSLQEVSAGSPLLDNSCRDDLSSESTTPFQDVILGPELGQGAFGKVYRASWNGSAVAVKAICPPREESECGDPQLKGDSRTKDESQSEGHIMRELSHPNIVQLYQFAAEPSKENGFSRTWLLMEFCTRGSLCDAVARGTFRREKSLLHGQPDMPAIVATAKEVARALCHVHASGYVHGDLSSNNVLLVTSSKDRRKFAAKIADFGMARKVGKGEEEGHPPQSYGTVTHAAPEVILGGAPSQRSDVFSFGVLLWEMYSGQMAWVGLQLAQIIHTITVHKKTLPFPASTPSVFTELANRCMAFEPSSRPSLKEIVNALEGMRFPKNDHPPAPKYISSHAETV